MQVPRVFVKGQCIGGGTGLLISLYIDIYIAQAAQLMHYLLILLITDTQSLFKQGKLQSMLQ